MGVCASSGKGNNESSSWESDPRMFIQKMKVLQQEINGILKQRGEESEVYERELMVFAFREAEWKRERKKLREEVKRLRKSLQEREERFRLMESEVSEKMRKERTTRDEAVEKWKMLYLAIKHELDDLIKKTHEGTLYWRAEGEDLIEDLQKEVKAKVETIEALKAQISCMEDEDYKRKREVDILRQSLRIMSSNYSNKGKGATSGGHKKNMSKPSTTLGSLKNLSNLAFVN